MSHQAAYYWDYVCGNINRGVQYIIINVSFVSHPLVNTNMVGPCNIPFSFSVFLPFSRSQRVPRGGGKRRGLATLSDS